MYTRSPLHPFLWVPIGQYAGSKGAGVFASYSLLGVQNDGRFSISDEIQEKRSFKDKEYIMHGKHGVEFQITLDSLGLEKGHIINLLLVENTHVFDKEGYSKALYTIK